MKKLLLLTLAISSILFNSCASKRNVTDATNTATSAISTPNTDDYKDATLSIERRVEALLPLMSIEEKVAQMRIFHANIGTKPDQNGNLKLSDRVIKKLKLGIAGVKNPGEHISPVAAAKMNNENRIWDVVGKEARLRGMHMCHSPEADIVRDPRFGRMSEAFGEDTYLTTQMVVVEISERTLIDEIYPPFEAAVKVARTLGVMASHGDLNGIATHGNKALLTGILRELWNFLGYVVSDSNDIARLYYFMKVAENPEAAALMGLEAGIDVDLYAEDSYSYLPTIS